MRCSAEPRPAAGGVSARLVPAPRDLNARAGSTGRAEERRYCSSSGDRKIHSGVEGQGGFTRGFGTPLGSANLVSPRLARGCLPVCPCGCGLPSLHVLQSWELAFQQFVSPSFPVPVVTLTFQLSGRVPPHSGDQRRVLRVTAGPAAGGLGSNASVLPGEGIAQLGEDRRDEKNGRKVHP